MSPSKPRIRRSFVIVVLLIVALCAGALIAGSRLQEGDSLAVAKPIERADGSLTQNPAPRTLTDVADTAPGPARAVMRFWYLAQWGGIPDAIGMYDPHVVAAVGEKDFAGGISYWRSTFIAGEPRIVDVSRSPGQTAFVTVRVHYKNARPASYSYTLERSNGRWTITFDTLLENAIAAFVRSARAADPDGPFSDRAKHAGFVAAERYRTAAAE
jgi:hypothetical protein